MFLAGARQRRLIPMRKRLRLAVLGSVVFLLGAVGFLVGRSMWRQHKQDLAQKALEFIPGVSQHIRDFHRVKVQDGRKVWEVSADDAQYFEDEKTVVVQAVVVAVYLRDGRTVGLKGDEGRILLDGRDVKQVDVDGRVEVAVADYTVHTDHATYDQSQRLISTPGAVEISGHALELQGDRMEVDVDAERLRLIHHVAMQLQPALARRPGGDDVPS